MPTSLPKRHHFIPQMLLRLFTDEDGNLFYFSKQFPYRGVQVAKPEQPESSADWQPVVRLGTWLNMSMIGKPL